MYNVQMISREEELHNPIDQTMSMRIRKKLTGSIDKPCLGYVHKYLLIPNTRVIHNHNHSHLPVVAVDVRRSRRR
jgi:hypothetical protein